jgi:hypothetical protein
MREMSPRRRCCIELSLDTNHRTFNVHRQLIYFVFLSLSRCRRRLIHLERMFDNPFQHKKVVSILCIFLTLLTPDNYVASCRTISRCQLATSDINIHLVTRVYWPDFWKLVEHQFMTMTRGYWLRTSHVSLINALNCSATRLWVIIKVMNRSTAHKLIKLRRYKSPF